MAEITRATAIANNEVAFLAWRLDQDPLSGCLGFHIVRELLDENDVVTGERPLASYVAFKGQSNPHMPAQNTTVWPIQKFTWRDLTLRRSRDGAGLRPANERVRYRIQAVGHMKPGLELVETIPELSKVTHQPNTYEGTPIPLGYLTPPAHTNIVECTASFPPFTSTFTNGILSTQFLIHVLTEDGKVGDGELRNHLTTPGDWLRNYLSGDVLPLIRRFFDRPDGRFRAALYELEDEELLQLLVDNADRLDLILSDAGGPKEGPDGVDQYDTRNGPARETLRELADAPGATFTMQDRLFNGSGHIGHNKFVLHVDDQGVADAVLTGSTNWTWSGVSGQSNNCIRIDDPGVAGAFLDFWERLRDDAQPEPETTDSKAHGAGQSNALKTANLTSAKVAGPAGSTIEMWFSPNVPKKNAPPGATSTAPPPPDMAQLFAYMRKAKRAIFFLVFMPSKGGVNSIVAEAISLGRKDPTLDVVGAISDSQAMWKAPAAQTGESSTPHVYKAGGVSVVLASALTDSTIHHDLGDFELGERLAAEKAIIHDKILVIDPMDPKECLVAFGSHNLGYRASYANDENLTIVRGHPLLAEAYATHVLDVYDHYKFRAAEADAAPDGAAAEDDPGWDGFLDTTVRWQKKSSHRLANYFTS